MANGLLVTFYSYKGGVGRSFALANVGVALAAWGYRVLCIDWDLEAPGLAHYFRTTQPHVGLVDLVAALIPAAESINAPLHHQLSGATGQSADWRKYVSTVEPMPGLSLDVMTAGLQGPGYVGRLQQLRWEDLYERHGLAQALEDWRCAWKDEYDFVLIDSRTGITDTGAICTAHLPDVLAVLFTANHQSLDGCMEVVERAQAARKKLPFDRSALHVLPIPSRFDAKEEYQRAQLWQAIFVERAAQFLESWIESGVAAAEIIARATIPYVAYWSFGEGLPVAEERARSPGTMRLSLETIAALIAHRLGNTAQMIEGTEGYIQAALRAGHRAAGYSADIYLAATPDLHSQADQLAQELRLRGFTVLLRVANDGTAAGGGDEAERNGDMAQHAVFLIGRELSAAIDAELRRFAKQLIDEAGERLVLPFSFSPLAARSLSSLLQRSLLRVESDIAMSALADRVAVELRPALLAAPVPLPQQRAEFRVARSKLNDANPLVRKAAIVSLGRNGDRSVIEDVLARFNDSDARVRDEAKRALVDIHKRESLAQPGLRLDVASLIAPADVPAQIALGEFLGTIGDGQGLEILLNHIGDDDPKVRRSVASALAAIGTTGTDWLMALADDPDEEIRATVLVSQVRIEGRVTPAVVQRVEDLSYIARRRAIELIAEVIHEPTQLDLVASLLSRQPVNQLVESLLRTDLRDQMVEWLTRGLAAAPPEAVIATAGLSGLNENPRLVAALATRAGDPSGPVRMAVASALGLIGGPQTLEPLELLLRDSLPGVRAAAAEVIGKSHGSYAVALLIEASDDPSAAVREAAVTALAPAQSDMALSAVKARVQDEDAGVRRAAVLVLAGGTGGSDHVDAFKALADDPSAEVRHAVVTAFARLSGPDVLGVLTARLGDRSAEVRVAAAQAMCALGEGGDPAVATALGAALDDEALDVRLSALEGLAAALAFDPPDRILLTRDLDGRRPWIDVKAAIDRSLLTRAARQLKVSTGEVRKRLGRLNDVLGGRLRLPPAR